VDPSKGKKDTSRITGIANQGFLSGWVALQELWPHGDDEGGFCVRSQQSTFSAGF